MYFIYQMLKLLQCLQTEGFIKRVCSCIFYAMINYFGLFSSELCSGRALPLLTFLKLCLCFSSASNSKSYPEHKSMLAMSPPLFHLL